MKEQEIISGAHIPSVDEVRELEQKYPYWIFPAIAALRGNDTLTESEETYLRRRIGAAIGREETREDILGELNIDFTEFYPDEQTPELTTQDTINAFLDKFGGNTTKGADDLDAIMGGSIDYASMMEAEAQKEEEERVRQQREEARYPDVEEVEPRTNLTESLAQVLIRNGNYKKALEILQKIAENDGEKSPYLDDQIRFLRKLVLNQREK